ncbi:MAG: hypothetical protein QOI03_1161 [Solirubrobacteraceae bacterium]|nr:hypothetical protein [Solirubrobacteraceae bacterium]
MVALLAAVAAACVSATSARAQAAPHERRSALLVFLATDAAQLSSIGGLSVGILSATQGSYTTAQFLLDLTQGARVSSSSYAQGRPPPLRISPAGAGAQLAGWPAARRRASSQLLHPGLLATQIPGGAGYAGVAGEAELDGAAAADSSGRVAAFSSGTARTLLGRIATLRRGLSFVVADLPGGPGGVADLRALLRTREPGELLIAVQRAPDHPGGELLWSAAAGLAGAGASELSSQTTNERGLIASIDLAPSVLEHLGRAVPASMRGRPIAADGALEPVSLRALMARLRVISARRLRALGLLLCAWVLLALVCSRSPRSRAWAIRVGAIGVLWAPVVVLIAAALEPGAAVEYVVIAVGCLLLGALTDRVLPWPRAPLAPALAAVLALGADALAHTQLLMRSLLGPDPILGARFYGIGNELKSGLAVLVLAACAAALYPATRSRRAAASVAGAGVALALLEGPARLGAGVGGVIIVCASFALAAVMMLPGALTRRRILIVTIAPLIGLLVLAGIDLASAGGGGHYSGSILHARSAADVREVILRRYRAAWHELGNHAMPAATAVALLAAGAGWARLERLLAPVRSDAAWSAALAGGLAAGVLGALVEDSGPLLLVVAIFTLGCVAAYLAGAAPSCVAPQAAAGTPGAIRPRSGQPRRRHTCTR